MATNPLCGKKMHISCRFLRFPSQTVRSAPSLTMSIQITLHISSSLFPQEQLLQACQTRTEIPSSPLFPYSHVVQHFQILTTDHSAPPKSFLFSSVAWGYHQFLWRPKCGSLILVVGLYLGSRILVLEGMRSWSSGMTTQM